MKIVVASTNAGKLKEIAEILTGCELVSMRELGFIGEIAETGTSFSENAHIKAEFIAKKFSLPALADDSGLCVDALGGAPGIYSSRYSGGGDSENRRLLLKNLEGAAVRTARFECAVCLCFPDGRSVYGHGVTEGEILFEERGCGGFGYDSLFFSNDLKKSFAEASAEEKNRVSHRFRALCELRQTVAI